MKGFYILLDYFSGGSGAVGVSHHLDVHTITWLAKHCACHVVIHHTLHCLSSRYAVHASRHTHYILHWIEVVKCWGKPG